MSIIDVPFVFTANGLPPRARNSRDVQVLDTVPLNIRELEPSAFPLAARLEEARSRGGAVDLHSDGRGFYRAFPMHDGDERVPLPAAGLEPMVAAGASNTPFYSTPRLHCRDKAIPVIELRRDWRVETDTRREIVAALVERAAHVVLCNGVVWEQVPEPCWKMTGNWRLEARYAVPSELTENPDAFWRADGVGELLAAHPRAPAPEQLGQITIFRQDLLRLAPEAAALRQRVTESLGYVYDREFRTFTKERFGLFADLRDAMVAAPAGEITDDLSVAVHAWLARHDNGWGSDQRLSDAYERWRKSLAREALPDVDFSDVAALPKQ